jgi:hypothetical protein
LPDVERLARLPNPERSGRGCTETKEPVAGIPSCDLVRRVRAMTRVGARWALQFTIVGLSVRVKRMLQPSYNFPKGEKGIGARGAPIPVVGRGTKIKPVECRSPESHANEGLVNSR